MMIQLSASLTVQRFSSRTTSPPIRRSRTPRPGDVSHDQEVGHQDPFVGCRKPLASESAVRRSCRAPSCWYWVTPDCPPFSERSRAARPSGWMPPRFFWSPLSAHSAAAAARSIRACRKAKVAPTSRCLAAAGRPQRPAYERARRPVDLCAGVGRSPSVVRRRGGRQGRPRGHSAEPLDAEAATQRRITGAAASGIVLGRQRVCGETPFAAEASFGAPFVFRADADRIGCDHATSKC